MRQVAKKAALQQTRGTCGCHCTRERHVLLKWAGKNQMLELLDDEDVQLTEKEILEQVLGTRSGYARGMGKFVIPITSSSRLYYQKEINNELKTYKTRVVSNKTGIS
uniref:Uncharacterized protein n=1 Tax=Fagus sylvatica TaxID=28930 RepID=A0A2N9G1P1_FAGSY